MRIDTGEELDIIHTTESLLVAVPTDGHTSLKVIAMFLIGLLTLFNVTLGSIGAYILVANTKNLDFSYLDYY